MLVFFLQFKKTDVLKGSEKNGTNKKKRKKVECRDIVVCQ